MTAPGSSPYSAPESQFSRSFPSRPSTGCPSACAGWSAGRAETVWLREAPLLVLRKPARKGGDRCPVLLSRCPAPAQAARVRRSRGRSWTRRKWVSSFPGPGRTDSLGRTELREGVGWGGGPASGSVLAFGLQAAGLGPGCPEPSLGFQGPCATSVARPTLDLISHRGAWEA